MSKRALKKYLDSLTKKQLEEQVLDLYLRFDEVKVFYNFVFNPKEDDLLKDAKFKISKEYFPPNNRKPKGRRSVAHKLIKHFLKLGVDPHIVADLMLFNIEIAQTYAEDLVQINEAFTKSMLKSYEQAVDYIYQNGVLPEFKSRIIKIYECAEAQKWDNTYKFEKLADQFI